MSILSWFRGAIITQAQLDSSESERNRLFEELKIIREEHQTVYKKWCDTVKERDSAIEAYRRVTKERDESMREYAELRDSSESALDRLRQEVHFHSQNAANGWAQVEELRSALDAPICRLQFPDGTVPGNIMESAEGWKKAYDEARSKWEKMGMYHADACDRGIALEAELNDTRSRLDTLQKKHAALIHAVNDTAMVANEFSEADPTACGHVPRNGDK